MRKDEIRQWIRERKRQFTRQQLEELSFPVVRRLQDLLADRRVVMAYYSLPDEVFTHDLIDALVADGHTVLLPRVTGGDTMEVRRYTSRKDLEEGAFHILEPVGEVFSDLSAIDTVLVPGIAFDGEGHRLGRGRGYYDRFLRSLPSSARKIGVCFPFQLLDTVPSERHDVVMDDVISAG